MDKIARDFGRRIRHIRIAAGLNQEDFASRAGLTDAASLSQMEKGNRKVIWLSQLAALARFCRARNVSLEWLILGRGVVDLDFSAAAGRPSTRLLVLPVPAGARLVDAEELADSPTAAQQADGGPQDAPG